MAEEHFTLDQRLFPPLDDAEKMDKGKGQCDSVGMATSLIRWARNLAIAGVLGGGVGACSGPMQTQTQTQQSQAAFEASKKFEAEKVSEEMKAKEALLAAEAARKAAGKTFAAAIQQDAVGLEARLAGIKAEADAARKKACELDPDLCPKKKVKVAVPPAAPSKEFVDVEITEDWAAPLWLTHTLPKGWELKFVEEDTLTLLIDGRVASWLKKEAASTPGCYRFKEAGPVFRCPAPLP